MPDRGLDACHVVRELTDTVVLKFSGGKDSVASWLRLREFFPHIVPLYHYWCPELAFVETTLTMYEEFFHQQIYRVPHPNFLNYQANAAFQSPHRLPVWRAYNLDLVTYDDIVFFVAEDLGLEDPWIATGVKAWDSPIRANVIQKYGAALEAQHLFFPVCDLSHRAVLTMLHEANAPLSADYAVFGRSFDGFQYRYLRPLRERYPADYAKICAWFPLVAAEFMRVHAYASEKETSTFSRRRD